MITVKRLLSNDVPHEPLLPPTLAEHPIPPNLRLESDHVRAGQAQSNRVSSFRFVIHSTQDSALYLLQRISVLWLHRLTSHLLDADLSSLQLSVSHDCYVSFLAIPAQHESELALASYQGFSITSASG